MIKTKISWFLGTVLLAVLSLFLLPNVGPAFAQANGVKPDRSSRQKENLSRSRLPADAARPGRAANATSPQTNDSAIYLLSVACAPGTWNTSTTGPAARYRGGAVSDGTYVYVFGGGDSAGGYYNDLWRWDPGTETWTQLANMPTGKQNMQGAYWNGKIYVPGGYNGVHITENAIYDIATNTWTTGAPLPAAQTGTNVAYNGKIYNFGGNPGPQTTTSIYDIASNTWTTGAPMPVATTYGRAAAAGPYAYYAGGITAATTNAVYRYDFAADSWTTMSALQTARTSEELMTSSDGSELFAVMGGDATFYTGVPLAQSVEIYDITTDSWSYGDPVVTKAAAPAGGLAGSKAMVQGGVDNVTYYNTVQVSVVNPCVPTNVISSGGKSIVNAGPDGVLDPGEIVTVSLGAKNIGGPGVICTTAALTGTLQASGGVTVPSGPQVYGSLCSGGSPAVFLDFTFTVDPALPCGGNVTATLHMMDGATDYGNITYTFTTGSSATAFAENFDGVVAPALPAGWMSSLGPTNVVGVPWVTSTTTPNSAPNDTFAPDPDNIGDMYLDSPSFAVPASGATLTFKNNYNTEPTFDGEVLEISVNGSAYGDIITAGGTFVSGGYTGPISTDFMSPIAGRQAWSGNSNGYITSVVNLPPAANGQMVKLRWRMASDTSVAATGVGIDDISIAIPVCGGSAPTVSSAVSRKTHGAAGDFDVPLPLVPLAGAVGIEDRTGAVAGAHTLLVTFGSPVIVGAAAVSTGTGNATFSVAGAVVTVNLTGVTNAQRLGVTLSNVSDGINLGSVMVPMGVLSGDTNGNGSVNAGDVSQTKGQSGAAVGAGNFRNDVNANGSINAGDVSLVKSRSGTVLPP